MGAQTSQALAEDKTACKCRAFPEALFNELASPARCPWVIGQCKLNPARDSWIVVETKKHPLNSNAGRPNLFRPVFEMIALRPPGRTRFGDCTLSATR